MRRALFVAASSQHTGKTCSSSGLVRSLQGVFDRVGYIKPVGQKSVQVQAREGLRSVDKDAPIFKELFGCDADYADMSPVLIKKGYTKASLEGRISASHELQAIEESFARVHDSHEFTVVEGTGHCGVGASVGLSNARVARSLGLPIVLVLNGGIGNTLDQFFLNNGFCNMEGTSVRGVIINKVRPDKLEEVQHYTQRTLEEYCDVQVLGCIPDLQDLGKQVHKLRPEDRERTAIVADHYAQHIDIEKLLDVVDQHNSTLQVTNRMGSAVASK
ncbi:Cobyrinic acid a,c-diamide synthase [Hondaea fermentalgiana]|uniref:Cobyrinic acid a,c-diamide synthase n=1 Tax=Hondaea fermentalgiana TaxID=2315210 RepID=A0A2R5GRG0_9STRA|nr:Cobyrinic acid a,c-diamide synthase [Hondaea fermentalgiana]|eukprot:GBG33467.1 Cobyrinic acid a,c-diamide synthase [Hondaea fermentalgiana]